MCCLKLSFKLMCGCPPTTVRDIFLTFLSSARPQSLSTSRSGFFFSLCSSLEFSNSLCLLEFPVYLFLLSGSLSFGLLVLRGLGFFLGQGLLQNDFLLLD